MKKKKHTFTPYLLITHLCSNYCENKNSTVQKRSSSGGVFTLLAEYVLENGGVVYGAAFDEEYMVRHIGVERIHELGKLQGSKYVQSQMGSIYLEVKEKFLNKKADLEKEVALRNQKIQQAENKLKQRELMLNQKQEEVQRKRTEAEAIKENLEAQIVIIDKKKDELDKLQMQEREKLEALSGLSAEEAKERLIESLKEEAKTQAASYINDIMDDAKLTANQEAKRIVIQSIQRVATETAIEKSETVFHIESDAIKGRIIGREGRNIRALEAATGVEIVVDDNTEAIVLSAFDPVRP